MDMVKQPSLSPESRAVSATCLAPLLSDYNVVRIYIASARAHPHLIPSLDAKSESQSLAEWELEDSPHFGWGFKNPLPGVDFMLNRCKRFLLEG